MDDKCYIIQAAFSVERASESFAKRASEIGAKFVAAFGWITQDQATAHAVIETAKRIARKSGDANWKVGFNQATKKQLREISRNWEV